MKVNLYLEIPRGLRIREPSGHGSRSINTTTFYFQKTEDLDRVEIQIGLKWRLVPGEKWLAVIDQVIVEGNDELNVLLKAKNAISETDFEFFHCACWKSVDPATLTNIGF